MDVKKTQETKEIKEKIENFEEKMKLLTKEQLEYLIALASQLIRQQQK